MCEKKFYQSVIIFLVVALFFFGGCNRVSVEEEEAQLNVTQLALESNDIQQWVEEEDGYNVYKTSEELYQLIDGGADEYLNRGLVEGFQQRLTRTETGYSATIMVMDFGTIEKAANMYQYFSSRISPVVKAGNYNSSVAVIDPSPLDGCIGYAHFKQFYIELSLMGYGAEKSEAYNNTARFIEIFQAKINAK